MPRRPTVSLPSDFFEAENIRALSMKKEGEAALLLYLQLLCMAAKQGRECRLMLYENIPLDEPVIARLTYKSEKEIVLLIKLLMDFHLLEKIDDVYIARTFAQKKKNTTPTKKVPTPPRYKGPVAPDAEIDWR